MIRTTLELVDLGQIREALRREREARMGSRAKLEEVTGIDQSTIYRIETDATYTPGVDTLVTLIEALPGLTLSAFFARIEGLPSSAGSDTTASFSREAPAHASVVQSPDARTITTLRALVRDLSFALNRAATDLVEADERAASAGLDTAGGADRSTGTGD